MPRTTLSERFWARVDKSGECWNWTGLVDSDGYGRFHGNSPHTGARIQLAHRMAYELSHGAVTLGLQVMHSCDNRRCCNPAHLSQGTGKQNTQEAAARGGLSRRNLTPLAPDERDSIARMFLRGESMRTIAKAFQRDRTTVRKIVRRLQESA